MNSAGPGATSLHPLSLPHPETRHYYRARAVLTIPHIPRQKAPIITGNIPLSTLDRRRTSAFPQSPALGLRLSAETASGLYGTPPPFLAACFVRVLYH